ncbi:MAG TPA: sulfatase [Pirellulales bacterium]|jgi:arylsulfatase A-like enzyme|nr:sulfatase [Pirellulales bacterium]
MHCARSWVPLLVLLAIARAPLAAAERPNILFIAVDDLNDWVGCLGGNPQAKTPNIDALAARGVNFERAYCASPVCNPSRTALMCGVRSSTSGVYSNGINRRDTMANDLDPLNTTLRKAGYYVVGCGKIYHGDGDQFGQWDEYGPKAEGDQPPGKGENGGVGGITFAPVDATDEEMGDYRTVSWCIEQLNKKHDKPLFLACGLHKPHMAWNVPRKYYDMFPLESIELPKVLESDLDDLPPAGVKMARPEGDHATMLKSGRWKEAVRGYLAAGAFCDAMIGRLMAGFDKSPYRDNTIIVFWGDHGWHLGEKQHWRKFALWEEATRAPLLFTVPGMTKPGSVSPRTVDFMCIYPTLCELCGIDRPKHVEGVSIVPLLKNPRAEWDTPALTTHGENNHAVRSERWRYIRYADGGEELYDEQSDPLEWKNLASDPQYAAVKSELAHWLPTVNVPTPKSTLEDKGKADKKKQKKAARRERLQGSIAS